jgi:hypothetical protein
VSVGAVDHSVSLQLPRNNIAAALDLSTTTEDLAVGQLVEVTVIDRSGDGRYSVRINGQLRSANSTTTLQPGSAVLAVVTGLGERLELRAVSLTEDPALAQALAALAARYRVELSAAAQRQIVVAAGAADSALATLRAGLYLKKLGVDVTPAALAAVAAAQLLPPLSSDAAAGDRGAIVMLNPSASTGTGRGAAGTAPLAQLLERVMAQDGADPGAGASSGFGDPSSGNQQQGKREQRQPESVDAAGSRRALSQELLSLSDGGALAYRYATLPLLVAGKLVELDMALFQQKSSAPAAPASPKRIVMSLNTSRLGKVRIVAQSLRSNLSIALASTSERGVAVLTAALGPMRERLAALGWQVDGVRCELATDVSSAGREIIDHVLTTGSLDRAL